MKERTCKQCGVKFIPQYNRIQPVCSPKCALEYNKEKAKKKADKEFAERKREFRKNDIPKQLKLTQTVFNRMRVKQEKLWYYRQGLEPECISCGKTKMDWCCGHYKTVASHSELRFDEKNTHLQCNRACNEKLSGNINGTKTSRGYKQGLRERFGVQDGQAIIDYCDLSTAVIKRTGEELIQMRKQFAARDRELAEELARYE